MNSCLRALALVATIALSGGCVSILRAESPSPGGGTLNPTPTAQRPSASASIAPWPTVVTPHPAPSPTRQPDPSRTPRPTRAVTEAPAPATPEPATPEPLPTLSAETPARYGTVELTTGFEQNERPPGFPHQVFVYSGGPIDVSYLGAGCTGFASMNPDYTVWYTSFPGTMGADVLRFYTYNSTLILRFVQVGTDNPRWFCSDVAPAGYGAAFDFHEPKSGRYDVWIGSPVEAGHDPGWLFITENPTPDD